MCAVDDAEPFDDYHQEHRTAEEAVECTECRRTIHIGETYRHVRGQYDDEWHEFRCCRHCDAAGAWLWQMCGGYPLTMLAEELHEHRDEYPTSTILSGLCESVDTGWNNGSAPIPDIHVLRDDADECMALEVSLP